MSHGMIRFIATLFLALLSLAAEGVEEVTYYHNDALGSPIIATDQEGRVVWRKSYAPYGQPIGPAAPNEPGYTGKFEEPDLGIQNFGARWYDPRIGRFLAIDPVGFDPQNPQSFNRYAYANNNPYRYVDPNGESPLDVGFFLVDTVSFGLALYSGNPQAIASAGADLAASAVGLASPIPGTGLAIKAARAADIAKAADTVREVANNTAKGKTVLGHYPEYKKIAENVGARRFNVPEGVWNRMSEVDRWAANQKFLDRTIARGDDIILATPLDKVRPGSSFAKELQYLSNKGHRPSPDGSRLIKEE